MPSRLGLPRLPRTHRRFPACRGQMPACLCIETNSATSGWDGGKTPAATRPTALNSRARSWPQHALPSPAMAGLLSLSMPRTMSASLAPMAKEKNASGFLGWFILLPCPPTASCSDLSCLMLGATGITGSVFLIWKPVGSGPSPSQLRPMMARQQTPSCTPTLWISHMTGSGLSTTL